MDCREIGKEKSQKEGEARQRGARVRKSKRVGVGKTKPGKLKMKALTCSDRSEHVWG